MEMKNVVFIIVFISAFVFLAYNIRRLISYLTIGLKENRFDNIPARLKRVLSIAFGQTKLLRDPIAGSIHFLIFWGFMLFLFAVVEAIIQGFYSPFTLQFLGPLFSAITIVQDVFGILVIIAVLSALFRRYVLNIERLDSGTAGKLDATFILVLILLVVVSMFGQNMAAIAKNNFVLHDYEIRPVTALLSPVFFNGGSSTADLYFEIFWWIHILVVFGFMNFLPYSKHLHVFTSIPNVFFSKYDEKKYAIKSINLEDENIEQFGAVDVDHLTWKQMLDGYACTECGRCTAACPAANTGKLLSPRKIIVDIRRRTEEKAPYVLAGEEKEGITDKTLVHDYISDEELWACTTCNACVYECPVTIEHVDSIVDMRRNLVLMESQFPPELNNVFKNIETQFTPWAFNWQDRAQWAEGLDVKTMAEDSECEYLFWVGCAGSFDARYQKVSQAFTKIMKRGNVDFRILGTEEKCNGDTARRLGNEYLAQMMMMENVETLNNYKVKKIVTACPHCYNSLKNEYPQFGGNFEVLHHSELIEKLLDENKIKLKDEKIKKRVTFHDSCYLGRYNGIYDSPRDPLKKINGLELVEMERSRDKGFCCGAGGGRMFLEETTGQRINENRTNEALETNSDTIASACPFCMTMLNDGVKTFDKADEVEVKDIAEIIQENLN
ncbi:MAG: (Fe-S)-binding protein [Melioribacteraceae bacterium]|nr:(Fe-S)-binding protein [Melioribacteraceae bacterium]MCF8353446.1 (Fe-S)-binding protein [Melioribacteraceae bacterium]MCF8393934.1 (Fe-S)-binding protein [Melioribacteraceae bacterium]MCF8419007.1 (Fe-S)-binding protein [Melioribacteraceae bacterium]